MPACKPASAASLCGFRAVGADSLFSGVITEGCWSDDLIGRPFCFVLFVCLVSERVWVISIARLRTLPPVHLRPIDVIVSDDP